MEYLARLPLPAYLRAAALESWAEHVGVELETFERAIVFAGIDRSVHAPC